MSKLLKKVSALTLAFLIAFTGLPGIGLSEAYAGNPEKGDSGKWVEGTAFKDSENREYAYPGSEMRYMEITYPDYNSMSLKKGSAIEIQKLRRYRLKSGGDIKAIMEDIVGVILNAEKAKDFPDLFDFETVKDMIGFEVVNFSRNKERLKDNVWEPVEDLAKVYRVFFIDDSSLSAAMIPSELLRCWGITRDELDVLAASNMEKMLPPVLYDIEESIRCGLSSEPENLLEKESLDASNKMLILTNAHKSMGAASALYPGVLEKVSEMMGDDLTIIPSSTEEVIIVPKSCPMPPKEIGNMVREVNRHMSQEDILSDRVYEFTHNKPGLRQIPESLPPVKKPKDMER